jgi:hypothetical protein
MAGRAENTGMNAKRKRSFLYEVCFWCVMWCFVPLSACTLVTAAAAFVEYNPIELEQKKSERDIVIRHVSCVSRIADCFDDFADRR